MSHVSETSCSQSTQIGGDLAAPAVLYILQAAHVTWLPPIVRNGSAPIVSSPSHTKSSPSLGVSIPTCPIQPATRTPSTTSHSTYTSSIVFKLPSTPLNHRPLSSNSSPFPPFSLPCLASFAPCTASSFLLASGPRSASKFEIACFFAGMAACRAAIWRSMSDNSASFWESRESVGCKGIERAGLSEEFVCEACKAEMEDCRFSISVGREESWVVWSWSSSYPIHPR